jgi:hypothetical protein
MTSMRSTSALLLASLAALGLIALGAVADPPSTAPAAGTASLSGVVVDEKGAPIAAAEVAAYDDVAYLRRLAGGGSLESLEDPRPLDAAARGTADAQGRFTLGDLARAAYTVVATAKGQGVGYLEGVPAAARSAPVVVIPLGPGVAVEGDVVDAAGKPIASAPVAVGVGFERETSWEKSVFSRAFATTDAAGHFRVEGVPTLLPSQNGDFPIASYSVCVSGPGGWVCDRFLLSGIPHAVLPIRFGGGATVVGTVHGEDGAAAAGARIVALHSLSTDLMAASGEPNGWVNYIATTKTGADGSYQIVGVPIGKIAAVMAFAGTGVGLAQGTEIGASGETTVDVTLMPVLGVKGTLTAPDGKPVADTDVFASLGMGSTWITRTDAAGRWAVAGLLRQPIYVHVAKPGFVMPAASSPIDATGDEGEITRDTRLVAAASVAGHVFEDAGKPVARVTVRVRPAGEENERAPVETVSGLDGAFLVLGIEAGNVVVSATSHDGHATAEARVTLAAGQSLVGVELRFPSSLPDPAAALDAGATPESVAAQIIALVEVLRAEKEDHRRSEAVERLRALGPRGKDAVPALVAMLEEPLPVWHGAASALSTMGEAAAIALAGCLDASDAASRDAAVQAFVWMEVVPLAARPALEKRLRDGATEMRVLCATALGHATPPDPASIEALVGAFADAEENVVSAALGAIEKLGPRDTKVALALRPLVSHKTLGVAAIRAAKRLGPAAQVLAPDLVAAVRAAKDFSDRTPHIEALAAIGKPAIPALLAALHGDDESEDSRHRDWFTSLSKMRSDSIDALLELAKDPKPRLRAGALDAIRGAWPQRDRVVAALVDALHDADPGVRLAAAERLGMLGSIAGPAVPALRARLVAEPDGDVAEAVIGALGAVGADAKAAVPEIEKALAGPSRLAAADALRRVTAK